MMRHLAIFAFWFTWLCTAQAQFADFNARGVTFGHMHLVVADIELHKSLWSDLFDAELVEKHGYSAIRLSNALIFLREGTPTAPSQETTVDHFGLEVRDLDSVLRKWRALGYDADPGSIIATGARSAFITMPGGVKLALTENRAQAERTSMGHVHFATQNRDELMRWYAATFGATDRTQAIRGIALAVPGSGLRFKDSGTVRLPTDGAAIDHIGFEIEQWDSFISALEDDGVEFEFGPKYIESLDLWVAFFNDPGGVLVEVTHGLNKF